MADEKQPTSPSETELELQPQPKVKRLNRLAILLVAIVAILVLWSAYFVLSSRAPIGQKEANAPAPAFTPDPQAIERLRQSARTAPSESLLRPRTPPPAPVSPRRMPPPPTRRPEPPRTPMALQRALEAEVLVAGFQAARPAAHLTGVPTPNAPSAPPNAGAGALLSTEATATTVSHGLESPSGGGDPNLLARKDEFLRVARHQQRSTHLPVVVREPLSPYEIREGTLIPAILVAGINSDLPGQTQALVRQNVYDSTTGRHLLIPQGSRLIGSYDNRIAWGQKRVLMAWNRLIFPDGRSLDLQGMPGADLAAVAGVRDKVNNHFVRTFGSAILLSAVTAGVQLSQPQESADGGAPSASQIAAAALGQEIGYTTSAITRRNINIQPTLEIRPGYLFNVEVTADLVLPQRD